MCMNCKPGDLAIVIGGEITPEMIGSIVKVIRIAINGETNSIGGKIRTTAASWICEAQNSRGIPIRVDEGKLYLVPWRAIQDRILRPISGLPMEEETEQKLKEPA